MTRWRPVSRVAAALVGLVVVSQIASLAVPDLRRPVLFSSVLLLDAVGVWFSFRAVRNSPYPWGWRLIGLARASAVAAFFTLLWFTVSGSAFAYWAGIGLRGLMFVLLAAATFLSRLFEIRGRSRWSFAAEVVIVVSAGTMLAWYFVIDQAFAQHLAGPELSRILGYVVGDLLVLTAVCSLLLGGARPGTPLVGGLSLLLVTDLAWNATDLHSDGTADIWLVGLGMVGASLLLTLAPITALAQHGPRVSPARAPAWSQRLVMVSLLTGVGMMIAVTIAEQDMFPWGGLVGCLLLMVAAVVVHMTVSLRSARDLVVTDPLTGLANRTGLDDAMAAAARREEPVALLLIDLDDFKLINDAYGHAAGDAVLTEFGHHLRAVVRAPDTCARIGGDEFAVLLIGGVGPDLVAQRILTALAAHPVRLGEDTVVVHASIGLTGTRPGDTSKELMRRADLAMYAAKRAGAHSWMKHDPSMVDRRAMDALLAEDLTGAAGRGELIVLYQPIVDLATGNPSGYEALVRWRHPVRGLVPPLDFIPVAERTGLIYDLGLYVLTRACTDLVHAPGSPYVSVNLSPRQLQTPTLVHDVLSAVKRAGLPMERLVLEVTESAIVDEKSIVTLHELRGHGIRIAVDDFGTGYSSLHYLTRLPVDILKIDRSFVAELDGTPTGSAIAEAVIRLAQVLRLRTIAEGIETADQTRELLALGCPTGQGFLYAKPGPLEAVFTNAGRSLDPAHPSPKLSEAERRLDRARPRQ
ncbi:bifunctional diguanylate cyclase/phosphodiesterase [Actinoplanes sp. TRM 88003]|uniref:Bifunctional diguanylate cyclase/phosphodiesterase n=1 Tax=Paractinoplanes aksuensis TaxID=2939490 RepID=A0ABT1E1K3_9ACTN|nr:bifunctional diguanylate cyclase/phosphodiesterase [Actinoplanes aksuensis]MCO8277021.1 bifunctional diguanylate cyclase/phosphodiesterase [Actinoplanes aksuensis]